jgi:DNA replication protein DnaC
MKEADRKEKEQEAQKEKLRKLDKIRGASLLGDRYKDTTFDKTDLDRPTDFQKAFQRCRKYCQIPDQALENGYGMYIYGDSGTGKTHLTACMCNELMSKMHQCLFTNFFEISKLIRSTWNGNADSENVVRRLCEVDFLFLDDLGTEKVTSNGEDNWLQGQVFDIINKRYNNKKPTIFSSNYSMNELIADRGLMKKTVDRIGEMSTAMIKLTGDSYRRKGKVGAF